MLHISVLVSNLILSCVFSKWHSELICTVCRSYNDGQYDFDYQSDGAQALRNQYSYMNLKH